MNIISNYKDYFDFLIGIYGIDEKIVLDRRKFDKPCITTNGKLTLFICDMIYDGYYKDGKFYWLEQVLEIVDEKEREEYLAEKKKNKPERLSLYVRDDKARSSYWRDKTVYTSAFKDHEKTNLKYNCPILLDSSFRREPIYEFFPPLKDLGIASVLPPKDIYMMLTAWLAPKDNDVDNRTNKEKITGAGFDLKTSFRNM